MTVQVATLLRDAGPWGQGFPEPVFDGSFELVGQRVLGDAHLKMIVRPLGEDTRLDAIAFNQQAGEWRVGDPVRFVYRLDVNRYFATPGVQLVVEHIEPLTAEARR
jgi:single-stranded-DNA-specific exonuclease